MKHDAFDEALRRRAQAETPHTTPRADARIAQAVREGRARAAARAGARRPRRAARLVPLLTGAAACAAAAALWLTQPPADRVSDAAPPSPTAFETVLPLAQGEQALAPQGEAFASQERGVWRAEVRFSNHTQDIYLVSWSVDTDETLLEAPDGLIWLEPDASCADRAAWPASGGQEPPAWRYTAYRVAADMLHWMDGDWLRPGEEGYAAQQDLIADAYEAGALILAPGDWENGMAGEMALALPDAMGNVSALDTYLAAGLIVEEGGGAARMRTDGGAAPHATPTPAADDAAAPHATPTSAADDAAAPHATPIPAADDAAAPTATPTPAADDAAASAAPAPASGVTAARP